MSEKKRQKKDGRDKNKQNQAMRETNLDDKKKDIASRNQSKQ